MRLHPVEPDVAGLDEAPHDLRTSHPGVLGRWGVPVVAWLASTLLMCAAAVLSGQNFWNPPVRQRWDSEWYLSIASYGYESFRCIDRYPDFPDVWCGNTAWFPGYPVAIRLVAAFGVPHDVAALIVSDACLLGSFAILWNLLGSRLTWPSSCSMATAVVFPGVIYFHVVFPTSMCLLGVLLVILGVRRELWPLAGLGAFIALSTHLVGVVGVVALAASVLFGWRTFSWPGRLWRVGATVASGALAYPWSMWMIHNDTGSWTIYWQHQDEAYGNVGLHNPLEQIGRFWDTSFSAIHHPEADATWLVTHTMAAHQAQLAINLAFLLLVIATTAWRWPRHDLAAWEVVAVLIAIGAVLIPLLSGAWSAWYRHNALMLVALPVLRLPKLGWLLMIGVCAVQAVLLAAMWFGGSLV